jgi:glycine/D-amino acid oxidase-like deaminating enzyme
MASRPGSSDDSAADVAPIRLDALIVGGGVAGLWLLDVLRRRGFSAALLEGDRLGSGQTLASQGMIHGGLKYALGGQLTGAAEAIADMPARWRHCLTQGEQDTALAPGDVPLKGLKLLSEDYCLWSSGALRGRLGSFFASRVLRSRIDRLPREQFPAVLQHPDFRGHVYKLQDLVIDVPDLMRQLGERHRATIWQWRLTPEHLDAQAGVLAGLTVQGRRVEAGVVLLCAGAGNEALTEHLRDQAGLALPAMQRRPLHQVIVQHPNCQPFYAHYISQLTRPEPRVTVTSHALGNGRWAWYLGGQLATDGVARSVDAQIASARALLGECLPWLDFSGARFDTLRIDRAEPHQPDGRRPDQAFAMRASNVLCCWPTKLSLVPDLADRVLELLADHRPAWPQPDSTGLSLAEPGQPDWLEQVHD